MRELERENQAHARSGVLPPIAVIGPGRLGRALARTLEPAAERVRLAGRDDAVDAASECAIALLCVPDAEIEAAARTLTAADPLPRFAAHTSGATALTALAPLRSSGVRCFSIHPLQTVPDASAELGNAPCAVAGDDGEALELARTIAEAASMRPFEVPEEARAAYHAAASIASNFLVTLEESAAGLLERAGIEGGRELLAPLVERTAANWAGRGRAALTGPIARGDSATVERHRAAIAGLAPELDALYEALAERTRALAREEVGAS